MLKNYFKICLRSLLNNKTYLIINVLGLSLGISGSLVIFQLVKFHLLTDSHHRHFKNIYRVVMDLHLDDGSVEHEKGSPYVLHQALKNDFASIENVAYLGQQELTLTTAQNNKFLEKEATAFIDANYFKIFDYEWKIGQPLLLNSPNNVVLTEKYAHKLFGDNDPINQTLRINNLQDVKIVGIIRDIPETTDLKTEIFVSLPTLKNIVSDDSFTEWAWFMKSRETYVQLKDNITEQKFESQLPEFSKKYYGEMAKYYQFQLQPLADIHFNLGYSGKISRSTIYLFSGIGVLLVLIACFNFINLSTAQTTRRLKEIGVRKVLGSSQIQIFWQFITEASIIIVFALVLGVLFSYLAIPLVNNWVNINISFRHFFDLYLLSFIPIMIIFIIVIAGIYPSAIISRFNPIATIKGINKNSKFGFLLRKTLVIAQFGVTFVLIAISIAVVLQINFLHNKDIGSTKDLIIHIEVPDVSQLESLKNKIKQKSFVESITFTRRAPSSPKGGSGGTIKFEDRDWEKFVVRSKIADENYLDTYQIKLVAGRKTTQSDTLREVLINKKLVKDLGLESLNDAIGKRLLIGDADGTGVIVGIVDDFNNTDLYTAVEPTVIFSIKDRYKFAAIKLNMYSENIINELKNIWEIEFPNDVFEYSFYDQELAKFYKREELTRNIVISFALLAIVISCLGLLGLVKLAVLQRFKEIGIRKVLGASVSNITFLLSKDFLLLVLIAILIASPIAYYFIEKWIGRFPYRVSIEWWIFALSGLLAVLIAISTISYQAIRAALMNPVKSLKTE
ncbi:MAG: ABC transporter permease [Chitinophagales bacterium]|nr:ABC transporter permease [Chitinophagales bacterium]